MSLESSCVLLCITYEHIRKSHISVTQEWIPVLATYQLFFFLISLFLSHKSPAQPPYFPMCAWIFLLLLYSTGITSSKEHRSLFSEFSKLSPSVVSSCELKQIAGKFCSAITAKITALSYSVELHVHLSGRLKSGLSSGQMGSSNTSASKF